MFSNGSEYGSFLERNCEKCPFYVYYDDATVENPVCQIEESIAMGLEEAFPYEWLNPNGYMARYDCRKRIGLDKRTL